MEKDTTDELFKKLLDKALSDSKEITKSTQETTKKVKLLIYLFVLLVLLQIVFIAFQVRNIIG